MGLQTTVVGSFPKPDYLKIPCWVGKDGKIADDYVAQYRETQKQYTAQQIEDQVSKAIKETLDKQQAIGIDVITDGEMRRDNYIYDFCRRLDGFDFEKDIEVVCRDGAWVARLPRIVGKIASKPNNAHLKVADDWESSHKMAKGTMKVKYTLPGPITIFDTMKNEFYDSKKCFATDMVQFINEAVLCLVKRGCKYIQIDEPLLSRYPEHGLEYAVDLLEKCFAGTPDDVTKIVHLCCGYPTYLDQEDYKKADQNAYIQLAERLDNSTFDQISLEDTHRRNSEELFKLFKKKTIILGVVAIAKSRVESVEEIKQHISDVLPYIPRERLVIAPDCGLIYLPNDVIDAKLRNMVEACKSF